MKTEALQLKPKMYSFLINNSERKNSKGVNRNVVATISHNERKDVLLNNNCIRYSMNRIQINDHIIGTYKIKQNYFVFF